MFYIKQTAKLKYQRYDNDFNTYVILLELTNVIPDTSKQPIRLTTINAVEINRREYSVGNKLPRIKLMVFTGIYSM